MGTFKEKREKNKQEKMDNTSIVTLISLLNVNLYLIKKPMKPKLYKEISEEINRLESTILKRIRVDKINKILSEKY